MAGERISDSGNTSPEVGKFNAQKEDVLGFLKWFGEQKIQGYGKDAMKQYSDNTQQILKDLAKAHEAKNTDAIKSQEDKLKAQLEIADIYYQMYQLSKQKGASLVQLGSIMSTERRFIVPKDLNLNNELFITPGLQNGFDRLDGVDNALTLLDGKVYQIVDTSNIKRNYIKVKYKDNREGFIDMEKMDLHASIAKSGGEGGIEMKTSKNDIPIGDDGKPIFEIPKSGRRDLEFEKAIVTDFNQEFNQGDQKEHAIRQYLHNATLKIQEANYHKLKSSGRPMSSETLSDMLFTDPKYNALMSYQIQDAKILIEMVDGNQDVMIAQNEFQNKHPDIAQADNEAYRIMQEDFADAAKHLDTPGSKESDF